MGLRLRILHSKIVHNTTCLDLSSSYPSSLINPKGYHIIVTKREIRNSSLQAAHLEFLCSSNIYISSEYEEKHIVHFEISLLGNGFIAILQWYRFCNKMLLCG